MRREFTTAAVVLPLVLGLAAVATAQEEAPAVEVQASSAPAPAAVAPAPSAAPATARAAGTWAAAPRPASVPRAEASWPDAGSLRRNPGDASAIVIRSMANENGEGQATRRPSGSSSKASSGSRSRGGSSSSGARSGSGGSDSQGRRRSPGVSSGSSSGNSGRSGSGGSAWDSGGSSSDSAPAARRRYPARTADGTLVTGRAVPRGSVAPAHRAANWYYPSRSWYGSWYPYGFGSWGLGFYMWDPYWYGWGSPYGYGYGYGYGAGYGYVGRFDETGSVRTRVKPRDAQVFVDGYYVGVVDEFDGAFQRLRLDTGPHRIEIRKEGFETLRFDVRVTFDHTITLRGELTPAAPTP